MPKISRAFAASLAAGAFVVICPACKAEGGICHWHAHNDYAVMPLLVVPPTSIKALRGRWKQLHHVDAMPSGHELSAEGQKIRDRKERKRKGEQRLLAGMRGEYMQSRPKGEAA